MLSNQRMEPNFSPEEIRVLGCLLEKERTTPEHYPLSLNSLRLACNQKSSRHPVVDLDEDQVTRALESLRDRHLVYNVRQSGARVTKYRHDVAATLGLSPAEIAVLALLLLRGPQTIGELRGRSDRLYAFESLEEVELTVQSLIEYEEGALARIVPRGAGQKEKRFEHALAPTHESPAPESETEPTSTAPSPPAVTDSTPTDNALQEEVDELKARLADLETRFEAFQKQFE